MIMGRRKLLAVLKCHPQEEGEKRTWCFSGSTVPELTQRSPCVSLFWLGWCFSGLVGFISSVLIGRMQASTKQLLQKRNILKCHLLVNFQYALKVETYVP